MKRLVHIWLRHGNIVLESARDRGVILMDHSESRITVLDIIYNDPDCEEIIDLVKCLVLVDHLFVDGEKVLRTSLYSRRNPGLLHMPLDLFDEALDIGIPFGLPLGDLLHEIVICFRLKVLEGQVIELDLDTGDTKPLRERSIDLHCLTSLLLLLLRSHVLERSHIVETVCKLYDDDPDILCHGEKHFSQVLSLHLDLICIERYLAQLRDTVNELCDFF